MFLLLELTLDTQTLIIIQHYYRCPHNSLFCVSEPDPFPVPNQAYEPRLPGGEEQTSPGGGLPQGEEHCLIRDLAGPNSRDG